jgi:hypothetical protein
MLVCTLKRAGFGFLLGMAVGNLIAVLTGHPNIVSPALLERAGSLSNALLWQTLLSGLIGAAGMGGISLYELEDWPLLRTTLVHYAIYIVTFIFCALALGWCERPVEFLVMAVIMLAIHFTIFLIMCARYRAQVKELNELNELRKQRSRETQIGGAI